MTNNYLSIRKYTVILEQWLDRHATEIIRKFYAGNYPAVLSATLYSDGSHYAQELVPYVIAATGAIGQLREAELTLALKFEELSSDELVFIYYHLAVANTNAGRFEQAASYVVKAGRLRFVFKDQISNFYLFMAFAYYRYAGGKARQSMNFAYRAGGFLEKGAGSYPKFLWLELMGNLAYLTGDLQHAADYQNEAIKAAADLSRSGSVRALKISAVLNQSKHNRDSVAAIAVLEAAYGELGPLDMFLKTSICFELVRHNALLGRGDAAHKIYRQGLNHATRFVSRRMDIVKLLRQIDIHLSEHHYHFCLPILESLEQQLLRVEDRVYLAETLDKLTVVCFGLSLSGPMKAAEIRLAELIRKTGLSLQRQQRTQIQPVSSLDVTGNLNYRQIAFLAEMQAGRSIDVHEYRQRFGVSEITACRDLSQLTSERYLLRVGKARATRYIKPDDQYLEIVKTRTPGPQSSECAPVLQ